MDTGTTPLERIAAWVVALPLTRTFTSARSHLNDRRVVVVKIESAGFTGWGEAAPVPGHTGDDVTAIWKTLRGLVGEQAGDVPAATSGLLRAAFNQAYADLEARIAGLPLWQWLGGTSAVAASAAIGIDSDGQPDASQLTVAAEHGYSFAKLKVTPHTKPARIAAVIADFPEITFGIDANGALGLNERALLASLDGLGLAYIEQPGATDDIGLHARWRNQLATPIALDESAATPIAINRVIASGAADIITLKTGRFGTRETLKLAATIVDSGLQVRLGGLLESGIGRAHAVAAATHHNVSVTSDVAASDQYFTDDLVRPQWRLSNGHLPLPTGPGIGVDVQEHLIARLAVDSLSVG